MGGDGPTTFDRVIEFCDGWMPIGFRMRNVQEKIAALHQRAEAAGRDPKTISITIFGANPGFTNIATFDVRPIATSPLVNAGNNAPPSPAGHPFISPLFPPAFHPPLHTALAVGTAFELDMTAGITFGIGIGVLFGVSSSVNSAVLSSISNSTGMEVGCHR